eukprot:scaffold112420_cov66-Phaeocystis_antarctica.AAC.3
MVTHVSSHVSTPVHVLYTERSERENGGRTQAAPLQTAAARTLQPSPRSVIRASVDRRVSQRQIELVLPGSAAHGNAAAAVVSAILVLVLILILGVCAAAHAEGLQRRAVDVAVAELILAPLRGSRRAAPRTVETNVASVHGGRWASPQLPTAQVGSEQRAHFFQSVCLAVHQLVNERARHMRGVHRRRWREIEACSRAEAVRLEVQARHVPWRRAVVSGRG